MHGKACPLKKAANRITIATVCHVTVQLHVLVTTHEDLCCNKCVIRTKAECRKSIT
jgi:hypothetical protein